MEITRVTKQTNTFKTIIIKILEITLSIIVSAGFFYFLVSTFNIPCYISVVMVLSVLMPALLLFLSYSKIGNLVNVFVMLIIAGFIAFAYKMIWGGFLLIANSIIAKINEFGNYGIIKYNVNTIPNGQMYVLVALIPVIILIADLLVVSIKNRLFAPMFLIMSLVLLAEVYFKSTAYLPLVILFALVMIVLLSNSLGDKTVSWKKTLWVTAIVALIGLCTYFVLPRNEFVPSQKVSEIKKNTISGIDYYRYNSRAEKVEKDVLPEGNLQDAKSPEYTDEVVMTVKMQKPLSVYLKGFIGSVYADNCWMVPERTAYGGDYTGLFEWLSQNNFYPESQISGLVALSSKTKSYDISVNNFALSSKYIYSPYESLAEGDLSPDKANYQQDSGIFGKGFFGTREYSINTYLPLTSDYGIADFNKWISDNVTDESGYAQYLKYEKAYRAFVYNTYLDVPDSTAVALNNYFGKDTMTTLKRKSYQSIIDCLRRFYSANFTLSSEIDTLAPDTDFIDNFLQTGHGYDIHFATLSVMILRSAGIPARYVEGYYIPPETTNAYADSSDVTFIITDSCAHAWAEIYVDKIGWVPVELTPGYYDSEKNPNTTSGKEEDISNKNKDFYTDQEDLKLNDNVNHTTNSNWGLTIKPLTIAVLIIIFIIIVYIATITIYKIKRNKSFTGADKKNAALKMFSYSVRLLKFDKTEINKDSALKSAEEVSQKYDDLTKMSFKEFLRITYKARFSSSEIFDEELKYMQNYIQNLKTQIYKKQNFGKMLLLRLSGLI